MGGRHSVSGWSGPPADVSRPTQLPQAKTHMAAAPPDCPRRGAATATKGRAVTYLIVGLDKNTLAPWHQNIGADDVTTARRLAHAHAAAQGINLIVAAVVGPNLCVVSDADGERATEPKAA